MMIALFLSSAEANAQFIRSYGIRVGGVLAKQRWDYSPSIVEAIGLIGSPTRGLCGYSAGLFAEFLKSPNISVVGELQYHQKGCVIRINEIVKADNAQGYIDLGPKDVSRRYHFLSIALMPKVRIDGEAVTPFAAIGPSWEIQLTHGLWEQESTYELAMVIAVGTEISLGSGPKLIGEIRYVPDAPNAGQARLVTVQNERFEFGLGLAF
jgi:hypothetical protein